MASSGQSIDLVVDSFETRYRKVVPLVRFFTYGRQLWGAGILILFFGIIAVLLVQTISGRLDRTLDQGFMMLFALLLGGGIVVTFLLDLIARNPGKVFGALCMVFVAAWLLINLPGLLLGIGSGARIADNASSQSALLATLLAAALLTAVLLHLYVLWVFARSALNLVAASKLEAALFRDVPPGSSILGGFFFRVLALPSILAFARGRKLRFIVIVLLSLLAAFFTATASIGMVSLPNFSLSQLIKIEDLCFGGRSSIESSVYQQCTNAYAWPILGVTFAVGLGFALFLGLGSLLQQGVRRLVRLSLEQLQRTDRRAPILFLRAFGDDQVPLRPEKASLFMRALEFGRRTKSLDQVLLEEGTPIGPVVALGNPTDKRPPYGAARGYFENKDWQEAVTDLAHNSAAIVICLDDTQGIWWEVEHLATRGHMNKTLFLVHPKFSAPESNRTFLESAHKHFGGDAFFLPLLETHSTKQPRSVMGFFIADGKLVILRSSTFSRAAFLLALRQFLRGRALPEDIRNLVPRGEHVVTHKQFGRDVARPAEAIRLERKVAGGPTQDAVYSPVAKFAALTVAAVVVTALAVWVGPTLLQVRPGSGESFRDCPDCPEMVVVPAGGFMMGSPATERGRYDSEGPQHMVTVARPFAVGKYEVTFAEWDACVAAGGCSHRPNDQGWGRGKLPVIDVSWNDITQEYLPWLSRKAGKSYRLLTEAEWEYAARAGTTTPFWWGSSISSSQANYSGAWTYGDYAKGEHRGKTLPADNFAANPWGLYNVHGNVWEWVQDCWNSHYSGAPSDSSLRALGDCSLRVQRGGSWNSEGRSLRSGHRIGNTSGIRDNVIGFRVAR